MCPLIDSFLNREKDPVLPNIQKLLAVNDNENKLQSLDWNIYARCITIDSLKNLWTVATTFHGFKAGLQFE